jgi:ribulose 1,5-bisphosphate synthetase/thiazole synthase
MKGDAGNVSSEHTSSLWMDTEVVSKSSSLKRNEDADVAIVGSGIAGLSTAYELSAQGLDVVVIDCGPIGKGMTARTTVHLPSGCDDGFAALTKTCG